MARITKKLRKTDLDGSIVEAFEIYNLLHKMSDAIKSAKANVERKSFTNDQWKAADFIK